MSIGFRTMHSANHRWQIWNKFARIKTRSTFPWDKPQVKQQLLVPLQQETAEHFACRPGRSNERGKYSQKTHFVSRVTVTSTRSWTFRMRSKEETFSHTPPHLQFINFNILKIPKTHPELWVSWNLSGQWSEQKERKKPTTSWLISKVFFFFLLEPQGQTNSLQPKSVWKAFCRPGSEAALIAWWLSSSCHHEASHLKNLLH